MALKNILDQIDAEIGLLTKAREILVDAMTNEDQSPITHTKTRRKLSPDARARIAAAQKRRWAKQRQAK